MKAASADLAGEQQLQQVVLVSAAASPLPFPSTPSPKALLSQPLIFVLLGMGCAGLVA